MKKKVSAFWEMLKTPAVIVALIGILSGTAGWVVNEVKNSAKLEAQVELKNKEIELNQKHEKDLVDLALLRIRCAKCE